MKGSGEDPDGLVCAPQVCGARTSTSHICVPSTGRMEAHVGRQRACPTRVRPSRTRHHGGSHRGPSRAPTEAFVPLMMERAL
jgi:hypothetical protein